MAAAGALLARGTWQKAGGSGSGGGRGGGRGGDDKAAAPPRGGRAASRAGAADAPPAPVPIAPSRDLERNELVVLHNNPLARRRGDSQRSEFKPLAVPLAR